MAIIVRLDVQLAKNKMQSKELASRIGCTVQTVSRLKQGKIKVLNLKTLEAICKELRCQPADLLEYRPN